MQDFSKNNIEYSSEHNLRNSLDTMLEAGLYVVATPIGNLQDITYRAIDVLQKADYVVCEDSRVTLKLLKHYQIKNKEFIIYNDHANQKTREKILNFIIQGKAIAFVSDAGTPLISDPGYKLVKYIKEYNQKVIPIPGASSVISALCASGLACDNFLFLGFFPTTRVQKVNLLTSIPKAFTAIFFESANRIPATLKIINEILGQRNVTIAKELTKMHEEIITNKAQHLLTFFEEHPNKLRGEFVVIIEKNDKNESTLSQEELEKEIQNAMEAGFTIKELSKNLAEIYDVNKKDIYQLALKIQNKS